MNAQAQRVEVLAKALFAAYSQNSGNPPEFHRDRRAAEQWMGQALVECGVADLIVEATHALSCISESKFPGTCVFLREALARVSGGAK